MLFIQILTPGLKYRNTNAFLFPLLIWSKFLESKGIVFKIINNINLIRNPDLLLLDSKFFRNEFNKNFENTIIEIKNLKKKTNKLIYVDTSDSTSWIIPEVLNTVDYYWKSQILKNKNNYKKKFYGQRIYTDFYNKKFNITDNYEEYSKPIINDFDLSKIKLFWNYGLYDYSLNSDLRFLLYKVFKYRPLIFFDKKFFFKVQNKRSIDIFGKFQTEYSKNTVGYQRKKLFDIFSEKIDFRKVRRRKYLKDMRESKITLSPFGYGELCFRDFEAFMAGTILLKPDMSHVDTWPNFYINDLTYVSFSWDLNDIVKIINQILSNIEKYQNIAINGQNIYKKFTISDEAHNLFYTNLSKLIYECY